MKDAQTVRGCISAFNSLKALCWFVNLACFGDFGSRAVWRRGINRDIGVAASQRESPRTRHRIGQIVAFALVHKPSLPICASTHRHSNAA